MKPELLKRPLDRTMTALLFITGLQAALVPDAAAEPAARNGPEFQLKYPGIPQAKAVDADGREVEHRIADTDTIAFATEARQGYELQLSSVSSTRPDGQSSNSEPVLFEDSMTGDWRENWFLDGPKAELETTEEGLHFTASTIPGIWQARKESPEKRRLFDSLHSVLWTKEEFEGEVGVSFEMSRTSEGFTFLLYMLAQGVDWGPYAKDITKWNELREIPVMSLYYHKMNLTGITFRDQVRLRRYPWLDENDEKFADNLIGEMIDYDQIPVGNSYRVDVELRHETIRLRIEEIGNPDNVLDKTYDRISDLDPRRPAPSTRGRMGLRHMTGTSVVYRNFQVRQL